MFPSDLALAAPIPFVLDLTLAVGPVLLLVVLALLDISAVALLHAALVSNRSRAAGGEGGASQRIMVPFRPARAEEHQAAPGSRAA